MEAITPATNAHDFTPFPGATLVGLVPEMRIGIYGGVGIPEGDEVVVKLPSHLVFDVADPHEPLLNNDVNGQHQRGWGEGITNARESSTERFRAKQQSVDGVLDGASECPASTTPVRDIWYGVLGLNHGDSAIEQYKTGFWELGQSIKEQAPLWGGAIRNVVQGSAEIAAETIEKVDPAIRKTVLVGIIGGTAAVGLFNAGATSEVVRAQPQVEHVMPLQKPLDFVFTASRTRSIQGIANEVGTTKSEILKLNPELQPGNKVLAGQHVNVRSLSSTVHFDKPVSIQAAAKQYGLTLDTLRSVNKLQRKDGALLLQGEVVLPGRMEVSVDGQPDIHAIADHLQVSSEVLANMNATSPEGVVVVPLGMQRLSPPQVTKISALTIAGPSSTTTTETPPTIVTTTTTEQPTSTTEASTTTVAPTTTTIPDVFASQRDNPVMGERPNGKEINASNTCNITSLTMALEQLGLVDAAMTDKQPEQVVVGTYLEEVAPKGLDITDPRALKDVAEKFNATADWQKISNTQDFWNGVKDQLAQGKTAILSISGHIVHLKELNDQGIVVDDPAGASVLLHKTDQGWVEVSDPSFHDQYGKDWYEFRALNSKDAAVSLDQQPGNNNLWPWADVGAYQQFNWILMLSNPAAVAPAPQPSATEVPATTIPAPAEAPATTVAEAPSQPSAAELYGQAQSALLDEIASGEGGWDSFNFHKAGDAHGHYVLKDGRTITQLTIAEVMSLQQKHQLLAVGRYQIIPPTMHSAVSATGIDTSRLFDAAAQNELAINYLLMQKREPLASYLKGEHDDVHAAANAFAMEWASAPYDFGNGVFRSFYSHSGGNHAKGGKERFEHIEQLLTNYRTAYIAANKTN